MKPLDLLMVLALAVIWGLSFLLVRIAAPVLGPLGLVAARMLVASLALLLYGRLAHRPLPNIRASWRAYLALGALNSVLPLALEAFAVVQLNASLVAILATTTPLFTVLAAALWLRERLTLANVAGVLLGLTGVAVLVGGGSLPSGSQGVVAVGAALLAALLYALGGIYAKVAFRDTSPLALAIGQELLAGLLVLPLVLATPPAVAPTPGVLAATLTLALVMTAGGNLLYFALITRVGPTRTQVVSFLVPVVTLVAGALLLGEPVSSASIAGLAIIFVGVALIARPRPGTVVTLPAQPRFQGQGLATPIVPSGPLFDRHSRRRLPARQGVMASA
ncbi:MAG: DMT family transporter [Chloroflexi bacterium OHK40]